MPDSYNNNIYDKITTTIVINTWSLFNRSGKHKLCVEYDYQNKEDNYLLNLIYSSRCLGLFTKIYLDMPFIDYIKYRLANWKCRRVFTLSLTRKNKYVLEKKKLLEDARLAYEIEDEKIYEKIYDEFFIERNEENV